MLFIRTKGILRPTQQMRLSMAAMTLIIYYHKRVEKREYEMLSTPSRELTGDRILRVGGMVLNATFNNISDISWRSVLFGGWNRVYFALYIFKCQEYKHFMNKNTMQVNLKVSILHKYTQTSSCIDISSCGVNIHNNDVIDRHHTNHIKVTYLSD